MKDAHVYIYLNNYGAVKGYDRWHEWALEHVKDKNGYPELQAILDGLKGIEDEHNARVAGFANQTEQEVGDMLKGFSGLSPLPPPISNNYYLPESVMMAVQGLKPVLETREDGTRLFSDSSEVAKSDSTTILALKVGIEKIRESHKTELKQFNDSFEEVREQLRALNDKVHEIRLDFEAFHKLKGTCKFEESV